MAIKEHWLRTTRLDRWIVGISLAVCLLLFLVIGNRTAGQRLHVMQGDDIIFSAPLDATREVDLEGPLGLTRLEIGSGFARVTASPCPYKVCIGMGEISREGEIVACVPNRLLLQVVGTGDEEKEKAYDLLSR